MFQCSFCHKSVGPNVKPVMVVGDTRAVSYANVVVSLDEFERETKKVVNSVGTEITREGRACPECSGEPKEVPMQQTTIRKGGNVFEEPMPTPMRPKLVALATYNAVARTEHKSKRANRECLATFPILKEFFGNNKKLVF